ncbi:nickel pincer cofactor biosynthesis protein LarC [uncultured Selenomonas sp.]|uniref:nickel pincer cofactor biosynthesis protein LarC n=1 Tax=uncultured Selenomonas sp. TaxID=159275 RepID=UPI0025DE1185|nr:nickel pincer cofactor biosynthesis protein LarC [uncultured Selenomonas sp.]
MAKAIYLDAFSGISGNMLLGAFLAAGMPEQLLRKELAKLPVLQECTLTVMPVKKAGISAVYVDVALAGEHSAQPKDAAQQLLQEHAHTFHPDHHLGFYGDMRAPEPEGEPHEEEHHHTHPHRTMADIRMMIEGSELTAGAKAKALEIFDVLAEAEGAVHGLAKDNVTFHEVGAADSIVDICGTAICLDALGVEQVYAGALNVGSGFVRCAHGMMPVPVPAVAELMMDWPTYAKGPQRELTTPTGAAVVLALSTLATALPENFQSTSIGYGAGSFDAEDWPNVLRLYLGETVEKTVNDEKYILAANIDDMNPQIYSYVFDLLLAAGALDVWVTPIYMKKTRPAAELSVLVTGETKNACVKILFRETTTIGLRVMRVDERIACDRRMANAETKYGTVRVKIAAYEGEIVNIQPEFEDCRKCAEEHDVPWKRVHDAALQEIQFRLGDA